jgi:hypothetical protein
MLAVTMMMLGRIYTDEKNPIAPWITGFVLGFALLAKGPVAVVVPGMIVFVACVLRGGFWYNVGRLGLPQVTIGAALVLLPWVQFIVDAKGMAFFREFIWVHNIGRFSEPMGSHSGQAHYYLVVLAAGFFPWIMFAPLALKGLTADLKKRIWSDDARASLPFLGLVWGLMVVALFSFSATKLPHYILPALPGFALFIADWLDRIDTRPLRVAHLLWLAPCVALVACLFVVLPQVPALLNGAGPLFERVGPVLSGWGVALPIDDTLLLGILGQEISFGTWPVAMGALLGLGLGLALLLLTAGRFTGVAVAAVTMWAFLMAAVHGLVPTVYAFMQEPLAAIGRDIATEHRTGDRVLMYRLHHPSVRFVSDKPFAPIDRPVQLAPYRPYRLFVVTEIEHVREAEAALPPRQLTDCYGGYCLIRVNM